MIPVTRLNHAVLYVRDLDRSVAFYQEAFGFEEIAREGGMMAFLRAAASENHHDLGLMAVGPAAPRPPRGSTGLPSCVGGRRDRGSRLRGAVTEPPGSAHRS